MFGGGGDEPKEARGKGSMRELLREEADLSEIQERNRRRRAKGGGPPPEALQDLLQLIQGGGRPQGGDKPQGSAWY